MAEPRGTLRAVKLKGTSAPVPHRTHYESHGWMDHIVEQVGSTMGSSLDNPFRR